MSVFICYSLLFVLYSLSMCIEVMLHCLSSVFNLKRYCVAPAETIFSTANSDKVKACHFSLAVYLFIELSSSSLTQCVHVKHIETDHLKSS